MATATIVTLPQMVDLALNSPEVGIVNFTVLHSLLHVIVKQLDLVDTNVEFRGSDSERLQSYIANAKPGPLLTLTEYTVGEDGQEKEHKTKGMKGIHGIVEKGKTDEQQTEKDGPEHSDSQNKIIVVESSAKDIGGGPTVVVTKHHFDRLEEDVKLLRKKVKELSELPENSALIEVLRAENPETTPVLDMFQILNLTKRLDAAEVGMQKLASLMEDLAKRGPHVSPEEAEQFSEKAKGLKMSFHEDELIPTASNSALDKRVEKLEKVVHDILYNKKSSVEMSPKSTEQVIPSGDEVSPKTSPTKKQSPTKQSSPTSPSEKSSPSDGSATHHTKPSKKHSPNSKSSANDSDDNNDQAEGPPRGDIASLVNDISELKKMVQHVTDDVDELKRLLSSDKDLENLPPDLRLNQVEIKLNDCVEQLGSLDHMFCRQIEILQKRISDLERDTGELAEKVTIGMSETNQPEGQTVGELYNKLLQLQEEMSIITENAQKLLDDREEKQHTLDVMLEQIELLKTIKADREDLEDALADKADACMVNRKVSVEQFDAACGDMSRAIEDSLFKLAHHEELLAVAMEEILSKIGNKLDKVELAPLRDYINKKLKGLQDKFKSLTTLKKDQEAAGTKSKYLRNVNCISCDKDVVMKKELDSSLFPKAHAVPPTRNMAPYLAYELDQLRKQQKHIPPKKDLNMFENALKSAKTTKGTDHLCNRYCGGSHTVTTPQQRVTRLGHFLEQWGPEIAPANDTMIRGSDGHMYRGRDDKAVFPPAESKPSPTVITEEVAPSPKSISTVAATPVTGTGSTGLGPSRSEGETGQIKRKSSLKPSKPENEGKPLINLTTTTAESEHVDEADPPPKQKIRKRSKGSVKYSNRDSVTRTSAEIKPTIIPSEPEDATEPLSDYETEKYGDPEA